MAFQRKKPAAHRHQGELPKGQHVGIDAGHRIASLAAAEATILRALSLAPDHAFAHVVCGAVLMATNRAAQAIAEYERALSLDRNLWLRGHAHGFLSLMRCVAARFGRLVTNPDFTTRPVRTLLTCRRRARNMRVTGATPTT